MVQAEGTQNISTQKAQNVSCQNKARMKQWLLLICLTIAFEQNSICQTNNFKPYFSIVVDTSIGNQLLRQCSRATPKNVDAFWTPTKSDIKQLENNFKKINTIKATECCWKGAKVDSLHNFSFQYLGVIIGGQKYIYINAFPSGNETWFKEHDKDLSTNALIVCDGGTSYWGVLFDLKSLSFLSLAFNGDA